MSDEKLLERIRAGDVRAFDELVRKYQREIYYLALRIVKNTEDAEEMTQQTFVKAFEKLSGFRGDSGFKTWLYQVALNTCRSHLRSRREVLELNEESGLFVSEEGTPPEILIKSEMAKAAVAAADTLPEKQRLAVLLRIFQDMSYEEIGRIIGCSEQTAKVNFHYGIETLRKKMKENGAM